MMIVLERPLLLGPQLIAFGLSWPQQYAKAAPDTHDSHEVLIHCLDVDVP
jgi:hypothetical protein